MNDLPPIDPTGAMSSGQYTEYMIGYDSMAADIVSDNLSEFSAMQTMEDWYSLWLRVIGGVDTRITSIETNILKLNQQITIIERELKS